MEKPGWRNLLLRPDFQAHLARVNIFVASHHGRENGYLPEVFDYCHPQVIIISDESKQYETQETNYSNRASGIVWNATDTRKVLTTRKDGGSVQD